MYLRARATVSSGTFWGVFLEEFRSVGESVISLTDSVIMTEIDNRLKTQWKTIC